MFNRILIANRGEIACRIIKTAKQLGIHCIAVYSQADTNAQHVKLADEAFYIGPAQSSESYLLADKIIEIAKLSGAQAIHPGYGFLSENAEFAQACQDNNIAFIGPLAESIAAMGSKSAAKEIMSSADVPLVPGYHGDDQSPALLKREALKCGFPLLLKAVAGGGGKGMRVVESIDEFDSALAAAQREANNAFGNSQMLIEKYMTTTRHIEVQVFCDTLGNGVYLSQRDCSIQRRHQKIVEEAPAPNISPDVVEAMGIAALNAAKAINYVGAGTVEFLYNDDASFYFMEMNTRLQVEHPVTEMITNVDLVHWQLIVASGGALPLTQQQIEVSGHALECRIYAEDPSNDFLPATGTLSYLRVPEQDHSVRVDTGVIEGDEVSVFYDPMISKLIVHAPNRQQAIAKMDKALQQYQIVGVRNNIPFLHKVITSPAFSSDSVDTQFIDKYHDQLFNDATPTLPFLAIASCVKVLSEQALNCAQSVYSTTKAWRMNHVAVRSFNWLDDNQEEDIITTISELSAAGNAQSLRSFNVTVNGVSEQIEASLNNNQLKVICNGQMLKINVFVQDLQISMFYNGLTIHHQLRDQAASIDDADNKGALTAPMNGRVIAVLVNAGDTVTAGTPLIIIEAMKMEHTILAPEDGVVEDVFFAESSLVSEGDKLIAMADDQ